MPINFHDEKNSRSYASRDADVSWAQAIKSLVDPVGRAVADIGCGGGIYAQAWHKIGASSIVGVDFSDAMVETAKKRFVGDTSYTFQVGEASATGIADGKMEIVFERALIHHLKELEPYLQEAYRILAPNGHLLIQDRTPMDVALPGSEDHLRGYLFECYPRLLPFEQSRRWSSETVAERMSEAGFRHVQQITVWETRQTYASFAELANDLRGRTGRSILHELTDDEIEQLILYLEQRLPKHGPIEERDRWTIWSGQKGA